MEISLPAFSSGEAIPPEFAFCIPDPDTHATFGANRNPLVRWENAPAGTKSFAIILHDPDVPSVGDDVNQEGKSVSRDLARVDFYHWILIDIAPSVREIPEGSDSDGVTPRGKDLGKTSLGLRGMNDYTGWFSGDPDMGGDYGGYDGPCPPWNDELIHRYLFTLYALDVDTLGLSGRFGGKEAVEAMQGRVLDKVSWMGTYTLNPANF